MNILFLNTNRFVENELSEFVDDIGGEIFFAETAEKAVNILNSRSIDIFFLEVNGIMEAGFLKYVNDNFGNLRIMLIADQYTENAINIFRKAQFSLMREPFKLETFRNALTENVNIT